MNHETQSYITQLEAEWSKPDGFLGRVREGHFDQADAQRFIKLLESIKSSDSGLIDRRLVSLTWYIPQFLFWQMPRVKETGGDAVAFERFANRVEAIVEDLLGVP